MHGAPPFPRTPFGSLDVTATPSQPKATLKPTARQPIGNPEPLQSHSKATPKPPSCDLHATSMRPPCDLHAKCAHRSPPQYRVAAGGVRRIGSLVSAGAAATQSH